MLVRGLGAAFITTSMAVAGPASGQDFPARPLRIVTAEVGGVNDLVTRLVAQGLTANLRQQVIVENRGGASGALAAQAVAKAPPDGYTLLLYSGALWIGPLLQDLPWDPVKDFLPVTAAVKSPNIVVVHPSLPVKSVRELIALAKSRPGALNYSSSSAGAGNHLAAELFKALARVNIARINYKGGGSALNALIAGEVQLMFAGVVIARPHFTTGRLRALAVCSAQPSVLAPGLPTVAASGVPGYDLDPMFGVFAPAHTPPAIIARLNQEIVRVLTSDELKDKFLNAGVETVGDSPEHFAGMIRADITRLGKVIRDAGIRAE